MAEATGSEIEGRSGPPSESTEAATDLSDDCVRGRNRKRRQGAENGQKTRRRSIVVDDKRNRATSAWRARKAAFKKFIALQANGYDCLGLVRSRHTGELWVHCSEGYWAEYKSGVRATLDDRGRVIAQPFLPSTKAAKITDAEIEDLTMTWMNEGYKEPIPFRVQHAEARTATSTETSPSTSSPGGDAAAPITASSSEQIDMAASTSSSEADPPVPASEDSLSLAGTR